MAVGKELRNIKTTNLIAIEQRKTSIGDVQLNRNCFIVSNILQFDLETLP